METGLHNKAKGIDDDDDDDDEEEEEEDVFTFYPYSSDDDNGDNNNSGASSLQTAVQCKFRQKKVFLLRCCFYRILSSIKKFKATINCFLHQDIFFRIWIQQKVAGEF
jgi:hypothetical protein